jgi:hypothetical protein
VSALKRSILKAKVMIVKDFAFGPRRYFRYEKPSFLSWRRIRYQKKTTNKNQVSKLWEKSHDHIALYVFWYSNVPISKYLKE